MTQTIEHTIQIDVPVRTAYNQWTQFEQFPLFMEGVDEVRQLDDTHLHWEAEIAGVHRSWDAEIVEQEPDREIAWRSMSGTMNSGRVTFEPVDATHTVVNLQLVVEGEGFVEKAGEAMGIIDRRVEGDLERFKEMIESEGFETGGWRGQVEGGDVAERDLNDRDFDRGLGESDLGGRNRLSGEQGHVRDEFNDLDERNL